jgi:putative transposase
MHIVERAAGDAAELSRLIRAQHNAEQRDRYRAALLAMEGLETEEIQQRLGRSRGFVQRWAYAYRDHGIAGVQAQPRGGSRPKLPPEQQQAFIARFKSGPTERDGGVCRLGGKDAVRILQMEFGVNYSLNGAYELLHRNGLSCLRPRPRHRKSDPEAQRQWVERAPLLSKASAKNTRKSGSKSGSRMRPASDNKGH